MKGFFLALLSVSVITGCGGDSYSPPPPPATPITVSIAPQSATVKPGETQQFTVGVTGTGSKAVHWSIAGNQCDLDDCGQVSQGGLYTGPNSAPNPSTLAVVATSETDSSKLSSAAVTIRSSDPPPNPFPPAHIVTTSLPDGSIGVEYVGRISASGGIPPYGWYVLDGELPPGLALTPIAGAFTDIGINGVPTTAGTHDFILIVGDDTSPPRFASQPLRIVIK